MLTIFGAYIHLLRIKQTFPAESKHTKNTKWLLGRAPFFRCPEGWVVGYHCDYHNDMNTCINITFNITIITTTIIIIIVVIIIIIIMIIIMIIFFFIIITIVTANTTITTINIFAIFAVPLNLLMSSGNPQGRPPPRSHRMRLAAAAGSLLKENQKPCISHVQVLMQATPNCGHAGQFINISHCPHTCGKNNPWNISMICHHMFKHNALKADNVGCQ